MKNIIKKQENGKLSIEIDAGIYDKVAVLNSSYKFTDKCYIYFSSLNENTLEIVFEQKKELALELESLAKEFCNELIDQQIRLQVESSFGNIRDIIVEKAFYPIKRQQ